MQLEDELQAMKINIGPKWIDLEKVLRCLFSISTAKNTVGGVMYFDKIMRMKNKSHCWWATEGKVNLLLGWGFNQEYFQDRNSWGRNDCPYKITVDNDMATVIVEMWRKDFFSENYKEAYKEIKQLVKTGELVKII